MSKRIKDALAYAIGNYRYKLWYSNKFTWLMRSHIEEQIYARIDSMDSKCYNAGECKLCGCTTTALQMANKACDKPCYPPMMSRSKWNAMKLGKVCTFNGEPWSLWFKKFIKGTIIQ